MHGRELPELRDVYGVHSRPLQQSMREPAAEASLRLRSVYMSRRC